MAELKPTFALRMRSLVAVFMVRKTYGHFEQAIVRGTVVSESGNARRPRRSWTAVLQIYSVAGLAGVALKSSQN